MNLIATIINKIQSSTELSFRLELNADDWLLLHQWGSRLNNPIVVGIVDTHYLGENECNFVTRKDDIKAQAILGIDLSREGFDELHDDGQEVKWISNQVYFIDYRGVIEPVNRLLQTIVERLQKSFVELKKEADGYPGSFWQREIPIVYLESSDDKDSQ